MSRNATATTGKAKSVIVVNNKLCGLNFAAATSDDTTPVDGTLNWTSNATLDGANTLNVGKIAPTNGKNTISADAARQRLRLQGPVRFAAGSRGRYSRMVMDCAYKQERQREGLRKRRDG